MEEELDTCISSHYSKFSKHEQFHKLCRLGRWYCMIYVIGHVCLLFICDQEAMWKVACKGCIIFRIDYIKNGGIICSLIMVIN
jgi:hypothetical protein